MYVYSPRTQGSKRRERLDRGWRCNPCLSIHVHTIRFLSVKSTIQIQPSRKALAKNRFYFALSSAFLTMQRQKQFLFYTEFLSQRQPQTNDMYIYSHSRFFHSCGLEFCCNIYADTKECCCFLFLFFIRVSSQPL